jgi:hypothetical protein
VKTYDNLMRRPVLGFFVGRRAVGVTARDPTVELPSLNEKAIGDETAMSTSSLRLLLLLGRLLADRVDRVLMGAAREYRDLLVFLAGVTSRSSSSPFRTELSRAL